jgi:monofunctional biosynthetic peptidoglycan transglycosylase
MNDSPSKKTSRRGLKPWKNLGWGRRILRIVWVSVAGLWLLTVLQVLLGIVFNPPLTPLMVQRFFQQLADDERTVNFERDYVPLDSISPNLVTAVVYSEDGLFLYHHGFDVKQMKIAAKENKSGKRFRGGSTISQQTAKNAFLPHTRSMFRKAVEAYYTMMIETFWSKRRIMEVYLNIIEFGDGIYGAEAASQHYFGHSAKTLSRNEAAQLAATLPAPLKRNPSHSSPYFRRRTSDIKGRFGWGKVDLENPDPKKEKRYENQESLWDFMKWYYEKR